MENVATYGSLSLFGNNYYGLRMASVICACMIFILLYLILNKILVRDEDIVGSKQVITQGFKGRYLLYALTGYILCDFSFMVAGRVAEPTIFRMLALMIVIYVGTLPVLSRPLVSKWYSISLGFLALASVVFVYIYNFFIFCALTMSVIIWAHKSGSKNAVKMGAYYLLGSLICLLSFQVFAQVVYQSSLTDVYLTLLPFKYRMGLGVGQITAIGIYLTNLLFIFITNIFRFNMILLFIFMVSIPVFIKKVISERNNFDILILNLLLFLFMQSIVINDYPLRKLIIMLPLVIIFIAISITYASRFIEEYTSTESKRHSLILLWIVVLIFTVLVSSIYINPHVTELGAFSTGNITYLNWGVFLVVSVIMSFHYLFSVRIKTIGIVICLMLALLPNLALDAKYIFLNRTYYFRDSMIGMSDKVDGKIVAGGFAYGFRLYNKSIPTLNFYITSYSYDKNQIDLYHQNFDRIFSSRIASYSIAESSYNKKNNVNSREYMEEHGLLFNEEFKFHDLIDGDIGLYAPASETGK
ncbi:MAG: hypothetical protein ABRQ23_03400 [Syntrophomonadaceae bacterium]